MTMRRMTFMAGGAVAPIALLALLFNNQWVVDATHENLDPGGGFAALVTTFQLPSWRLTAGRYDWTYVLVLDLALLLFFALLAGLVFAGARVLEPGRGTLGAVITGWWATTVAAGVSSLIGSVLFMLVSDVPGRMFGRTVWNYVSGGASYGLLFGWIAGLGALGGFLLSRPRTQGGQQQPYGAQPPYGAQQPYAAQQPYGQQPYAAQPPQQAAPQQAMPQQPHPSAVPYVPPQGQPQQPPAWGAAPVPQQPGVPVPQQPGAPQQFGAPPVPPQQPQQPAQEQPAQEQPAQEQPAPPEPERPADEDAEPAEPAAETPGDDARPDTPEDDDLGLADRTIVDRRRDDD